MKRREFIKSTAIGGAALALGTTSALAEEKKQKIISKNALPVSAAIDAVTGGKPLQEGKIKLTAPDIAENGAVVPVKATVDYPMESGNYVKAIHIFTEKNQNSRCASVILTPANGEAFVSTRVKLGETQKVIIVAETSKGEFFTASKEVKVTIGGCG